MEKVFLRLDGVRGESKAVRHVGDIEIYSFSWDVKNSSISGKGGQGRERASTHDLTIFKPVDTTTQVLRLASANGRSFASGELTIEEVSKSGGLLRSVIFKLHSIVLTAVTTSGGLDTIGINFQSAFLVSPETVDKKPSNGWNTWDDRRGG
jgi:type VI secretion system secreted protein Hcp